MKNKHALTTVSSIVILFCLWQIAAAIINAPVILPAPYEVLGEFFRLFTQKSFYLNLGSTILRALESFVIIVFFGALFGILAGNNKDIETLLKPLVTVFKATPVMSVILIAFIWFRTGAVPVFSAFLMAFPVMFVQTVQGMHNLDKKLLQMCDVYKIDGTKRLLNFTIPAMMPSLVTGAKQSLSMIWKVVIAAEVLTIPEYGIGRSLQLSQIQLETATVFAWTVIAIILTSISDAILTFVLKRILGRRLINETH